MNSSQNRHRRHSAAERRALVTAWKQSGVSSRDFAKNHDVSVASLLRWRQRADREAGPTFVPVGVTPAAYAGGARVDGAAPAEVQVQVGTLRVRIMEGSSAQEIADLVVAMLEVRRC